MPSKLKSPCNYPGCRRAVRERYCDQHRHAASQRPADRRRGTAAQRGYDRRWRKLRRWYITEHPLCEDCQEEGLITFTNIEVDHVIPISVRPDLRLDADNLRSRCRRHHKLKTDADERQYGRSREVIIR